MAEVHLFAFGWITPALSIVMSSLGCLLGIVLTTRSRGRTRRARGLIYASIALAVTGVWQAHTVGLIGLEVAQAGVRFDPLLIAASLGAALVTVGGGIFLIGFRRRRFFRLLGALILLSVGMAGSHYIGLMSVRVGGSIQIAPRSLLASLGIATIAAGLGLWFIVGRTSLWAAVLAAISMGTAVCSLHYVALIGADLRLTPGSTQVDGMSPMTLLAPVILLAAAGLAMLWFFTVGNSTVDELHAIFTGNAEAIEPWMIHEVTARIAIDVAPSEEAAEADLPVAGRWRRPPGPRPTPGIVPVWRHMPVWGTVDSDKDIDMDKTAEVNRQAVRRQRQIVLVAPTAPNQAPNTRPANAIPGNDAKDLRASKEHNTRK